MQFFGLIYWILSIIHCSCNSKVKSQRLSEFAEIPFLLLFLHFSQYMKRQRRQQYYTLLCAAKIKENPAEAFIVHDYQMKLIL
jgi:hypothetical protein